MGASAPPPPPPYYGSIFTLEPAVSAFSGQIGWWSWGGSITAPSVVSSNPPTRDAYTYPDGEAEYVYTFNGTDNWMISPQLTTTGAWPDGNITVDMWFYPTSYGITLLAELGQNTGPNVGYDYNMLEIDSSGYLLATVFPSGHITSPNTVTLNAWNHVYFFHDVQNSLRLELNGNLDGSHAVNGTASSGYTPPGQRYFGIGGGGNGTNMGNVSYFQGKIGTVYIYDTVAQSSYNATKIKHAVPELLLNLDASNPASYAAQYTVTVSAVTDSGTKIHIPTAFSANIGNQVTVGYPFTTQWGGYHGTVTNISTGTGSFGAEWIFTVDTNVAIGFAGGDNMTFGSASTTTWYNLVSGGHDATFDSAPAFYSTGVKSIDFAGYNFATLPADIWFNQDLTIVSWVKVHSYANWERIIDFGNGAGVNTVLLAASAGVSGNPALRTEGTQFTATNYQLPVNTWVQVAGRVKADGGGTIFVNGDQMMNYSGMAIPVNTTRSNCYIGKSNWPDALLNGEMGEIQIYHSALSDAVITANYNSTRSKYLPSSLSFSPSSTSYLGVQNTQSDWALGTTWTIEWWSKATTASGPGTIFTVMGQNFDGNGIDVYYQNGNLIINNGTTLTAEPTPGSWTHVALVSNGTQTIAYLNGGAQYVGGAWNLNNSSNDLVIGKRGPGNFQYFNGNLANIRISTTAKYTDTFTPSKTYGVESDTKLFLGGTTPLVDGTGNHPIDNQGAVVSTDFPT